MRDWTGLAMMVSPMCQPTNALPAFPVRFPDHVETLRCVTAKARPVKQDLVVEFDKKLTRNRPLDCQALGFRRWEGYDDDAVANLPNRQDVVLRLLIEEERVAWPYWLTFAILLECCNLRRQIHPGCNCCLMPISNDLNFGRYNLHSGFVSSHFFFLRRQVKQPVLVRLLNIRLRRLWST